MSMSINNNPEYAKEKFTSRTHFKKVIADSVKKISLDVINFCLLVSVLITGIGELIGRSFSIQWYILILLLIIIYSVDKKLYAIIKKTTNIS